MRVWGGGGGGGGEQDASRNRLVGGVFDATGSFSRACVTHDISENEPSHFYRGKVPSLMARCSSVVRHSK